jgi:P3 major capsid protein
MPPANAQGSRTAATPEAVDPRAINARARAAVLAQAVEMKQQIFTGVISASQAAGQAPINIIPRAVGLVKKFIVEISGTANNTDGANAANISDIGLDNLLAPSNGCVFTDLQNNVRIQTAGWHLGRVFKAKHRWGAADALLATALVEAGVDGNVFGIEVAPTGFAHGTSQPFAHTYEIPISYSDEDLRGATYLGVVNAVAQLQLNLNPSPFAAAGVDSTTTVWKGATGTLSAVTVTVYQVYLDQLPQGKGGPILPPLDLSTVYELKNTTNQQPFQVGQDNPLSYANFRRFLSTSVIYNDNPAADAGRTAGTDVNYFALQSANFTNIFKTDALEAARLTRVLMYKDLPKGCYYFSHRKKPISTISYGNMQLIINPSTAAAGAYSLIGWEDFATVNALMQAGSLAG